MPKQSAMLVVLCGFSACAPGNSAIAADPDSSSLGEIVVTAQKTPELLSKVPISITSVTGAQLAEQHVEDFEDLSRIIPNLSFSSFGGPGQDNIEIRGISSQAGSATTGIYLDDVPINIINIYTAGATAPRFFDIDRVEVLRGPQGTIYGSSSLGGTIHFVSVQPDLNKFSASASSQIGGTDGGGLNYEGGGIVNIPLIDGTAALRMGALYRDDSGWINRVNPAGQIVDTKINYSHSEVARATLEFKPTDSLTITPAVFLQRVINGGNSLFGLDLPEFESPTLVRESGSDTDAISSLTIAYDFGPAELTSITGYFQRQDNRWIDGTQYDTVYLGQLLQAQYGYGGAAVGAVPAPSAFDTSVSQFHEEIRVASKPATGDRDRWSWIAGLYFSKNRTDLIDDEHAPGFSDVIESVYGGTPDQVLGGPFPSDLIYYASSIFVNKEEAAFGQATYNITTDLRFTAGLRYEVARESLDYSADGYLAGGALFSSTTTKGNATTPKFALAYDLSSDAMLYASAAKGFRVGGANRPVAVPLCSADLAAFGLAAEPGGYKPDSLWSYELGLKMHDTANTLTFSAALFDIRWNNIQTDIILPDCGFDFKDNIGSADSRGVEMELNERVTDHLKVALSGSYTAAKITDPVIQLGVERGDRVPGVPEYSVATNIEYSTPLERGGRGFARVNGQWTGPSQGVITHGDPDFSRPSYFVAGGSVGVDFGRYMLSLFGTNLLNDHKVIQRPLVTSVEYGVTVTPRTFGLSGNYTF